MIDETVCGPAAVDAREHRIVRRSTAAVAVVVTLVVLAVAGAMAGVVGSSSSGSGPTAVMWLNAAHGGAWVDLRSH